MSRNAVCEPRNVQHSCPSNSFGTQQGVFFYGQRNTTLSRVSRGDVSFHAASRKSLCGWLHWSVVCERELSGATGKVCFRRG